jgi:hypothetical protein
MMAGYDGCGHQAANLAFWQSSLDNGAYLIAPDLCPYGKYGYDPRCRDWYASGKNQYETSGAPVHITPPYAFGLNYTFASSATSPIANPETGEYVGQVLLDLVQTSITDAVSKVQPGQLSILISPDGQVVACAESSFNGTSSWTHTNVSDLLFPFDAAGSSRRAFFEQNILPRMQSARNSVEWVNFSRTKSPGVTETLLMAFSPVFQRALLPHNPADFSRGVKVTYLPVYSMGVLVDVLAAHEPFSRKEDDIQTQLSTLNGVYIGLTVFVSVLFTIVACIVSTIRKLSDSPRVLI